MKMLPEYFDALRVIVTPAMERGLIDILVDKSNGEIPAFRVYAWRFFWQSHPENWLRHNEIYRQYNDNHIQTALLKILKEVIASSLTLAKTKPHYAVYLQSVVSMVKENKS